MKRLKVQDVRNEFIRLKETNTWSKNTLEIQSVSFEADEPSIFGKVNKKYVEAELEWYNSESRNVNDIAKYYPKVPDIWQQVSSDTGLINSNYGWCIYSYENGRQYNTCRDKLQESSDTRHAVMYYTRPTIHHEANFEGMSDHICTFAVQYHSTDGYLDAHVYMRSNDAVFGYNNDFAWQEHVLRQLADDTDNYVGKIMWNVSSLHVYPGHVGLVHNG